jgi:hypothetical protein
MGAVPQIPANPDALRLADRKGAPSHLLDVPAPLRLWHLLSLDAPTVAVVWALGFAWAAGVWLPVWVPVLLALAAWVVYTGDRLLDARSGRCEAAKHRLRERHRFHWKHRRILAPLAVVAAIAAGCMVLVLMPPVARERDTVLAAAALAYFTRVHATQGRAQAPSLFLVPALSKELLVGVLFTAGCALPALNRASAPLSLLAPAVFFAALAWLNCHAIEWWESAIPVHRPRGWASDSRAVANLDIFAVAALLGGAGMLLAAGLAGSHPRPAGLLAAGAASALLLALLDRARGRLTALALRAAADLVLLTPLALLLR